jgi:hypothetical protein
LIDQNALCLLCALLEKGSWTIKNIGFFCEKILSRY